MVYLAVDFENNSSRFWQAFQERFANLAHHNDLFVCSEQTWAEIQSLPGWDDGEPHAPHPLVVTEPCEGAVELR